MSASRVFRGRFLLTLSKSCSSASQQVTGPPHKYAVDELPGFDYTDSVPDLRIALVERKRKARKGLAALISGSAGMGVVAQYRFGEEALHDVAARRPNVVLTDLGHSRKQGAEVVASLHRLLPRSPILVLSVHGEERYVSRALCAGASGYLLKDVEPARLVAAIREVHQGGSPMSPVIARRVVRMLQRSAPAQTGECHLSKRELEVLTLMAEGYSYKKCADRLAVSIDTVRFHVRRIYERLQVHSRTEAVIKGLRGGWIR